MIYKIKRSEKGHIEIENFKDHVALRIYYGTSSEPSFTLEMSDDGLYEILGVLHHIQKQRKNG